MVSGLVDREAVLKSSRSYYANRAFYYDLLAQRKDRDPATNKELDFLERVFKNQATRSVRRVLDVACGGGRHVVGLARRGYECVGQDLTPDRVAMARARAKRSGLSLPLSQGDATRLPYTSEFDAVLALYILFLLPSDDDVAKCLRQAHNSLRRGGLFVCNVFNPFSSGPRSLGRLIQRQRQVVKSRAPGIRMTEISQFQDIDPMHGWGWLSESIVIEAPDGPHAFRDRERLRFFTYSDIIRMLEDAGFREPACYPDWMISPRRRPKAKWLVFTARK